MNNSDDLQLLVNQIFQNGVEEGSRIWNDVNHPLHQAVQVLLNKDQGRSKEAAMLIEQHRRMEEGK